VGLFIFQKAKARCQNSHKNTRLSLSHKQAASEKNPDFQMRKTATKKSEAAVVT